MNLVSSAGAGRGPASLSPRRKVTKALLLGLTVVAVFLAAFAWPRPAARSSAADPAGAAAANPLAELSRSALDNAPITGRVEERLSAGSYTYLSVRTGANTSVWVVTLGGGSPPGAPVKVRSMGRRADFYSSRLKRTFPELIFGIISRPD
jgi:hypothetical protein